MSAAKTDSPFIYALVLFSQVCGTVKYAGFLWVNAMRAKLEESLEKHQLVWEALGGRAGWGVEGVREGGND